MGFIFSQAAVFRLQQLSNQVYQCTGVRHKLSHPGSIVSLLNEGAQSPRRDVRNGYDAFVMELNKRQIDALLESGANLRLPIAATRSASGFRV